MTRFQDGFPPAADVTELSVDADDGTRIAVRDYGGDGRTLIFIHGGPGPNLASWDAFARRLSGSFRCIAYDQRGHGQSSQSSDYTYAALIGDLQRIVKTLDIAAAVVVGHSWGGMIGLMYAAAFPETCAGIVAVDGILTGEDSRLDGEAWAWFENELRSNPFHVRSLGFEGTEADVEIFLEWARAVAPTYHKEFSEAAFRRDLIAGPDGLLRGNHTGESLLALNRAVDIQALPGIDIYGSMRCPILLVMATDGKFQRASVRRIKDRYPDPQVVWLDCGHLVQDEMPGELEVLIREFTTTLPGAGESN